MGNCSSKKSRKIDHPASRPIPDEGHNKPTPKEFSKLKTDFRVGPDIFVVLKKGDISNAYYIEHVLGEGASGKVSLVRQKLTGLPRAMKQIPKEKIQMESEMCSEVNILKHLDHPNIVNIYELFQDANFYYLITEYLSGGELFEKLKRLDHFTERMAANFMKQILSAVYYCHQRNITHRDLKPENIIFESNKENANLKIIDFGTAKQVQPDVQLSQRIGTPYYIAPEVINKKYDMKCDVWSCGVILFIMLSGYPPFNGTNQTELYERITQGVYSFDEPEWLEVSSEAKDLIRKMLIVNPSRRVSAEEALHDIWIQSNAKDHKINKRSLENLHKFHVCNTFFIIFKKKKSQSKLMSAIMELMATQMMGQQDKEKLKKAFQAIDKNGDGTLSREELIECYMNIYHDEFKCNQMVDELMNSCDFNNSQQIEFAEFLVASAEKERLLSEARLEKAFKMFDKVRHYQIKDGNGIITKSELQEIMGGLTLSDPDWNNVFGELDLDGDGTVSFKEFASVLLKSQ